MNEDSVGEKPESNSFNSKEETILKQNWEHARFCEYEMILFTSIYGAIVAGALVFMSKIDYEPINLGLLSLLSLFLLILSVLGFRVVISQSLGHHNYIINVLMILECWGKTGFFKNPKKPFFLKRSCRKFYEATIAFFFTLFVFFAFYAIKGKVPDTITFRQAIFFIAMFSFIYFFIENVLYKYKWSRYSMKRRLLIEAIRKGEKKFYRPDWDLQLEDEESDLWEDINDTETKETSTI